MGRRNRRGTTPQQYKRWRGQPRRKNPDDRLKRLQRELERRRQRDRNAPAVMGPDGFYWIW